MDVSNMLNKIMKECNGGKYNKVNSTQADILRDAGRTLTNMVTLDGATIEGACGLIDVMIRALDVERFSKFSSLNKVSKVDKFADLVTEKDIYRCQHCTKSDALTSKLRKVRQQYPDDFKYPNFCMECYERAKGVPRWERREFLRTYYPLNEHDAVLFFML